MKLPALALVLVYAFAGAALAVAFLRLRLRAPASLHTRSNVRGREVPVVLGEALALAAGAVLMWELIVVPETGGAPVSRSTIAATLLVLMGMAAAGRWDDRRGDERPRGYSGHLSAARHGRLTGGLVKMVAGGAVGLAAATLATREPLAGVLALAVAIALSANLVNLLDRAPGRAGKVSLLIALPLLALGDPSWAFTAAPVLGALVALLPADLRERGMLGDEGANPLGGVLGLGLGLSLPGWGMAAAVLLLLLLNAASERWSFSQLIARIGLLRALDDLGRSAGQQDGDDLPDQRFDEHRDLE